MKIKFLLSLSCCLGLLAGLSGPVAARPAARLAASYYVSSSGGNDINDGLSESLPFRTIAKVNSLALQPGDQVLFKCGDTWQAEQLVVSKSGSAGAPITFSSYPAGCANPPVLSGSRSVSGWSVYSGSIYVATLSTTDFPYGLNQLFRNGTRLALGRWPNLDNGAAGYSFVDGHTSGGAQLTDNELPAAVNWTGAIVHIKNIRWSMLDRQVTGSSGTTLTLNAGLACLISSWGSCTNWGYFINNHLSTLDRDGEWYYDAATRKVYLVSSIGVPANIEGSVILTTDASLQSGGLMLSDGSATAYVGVDNFVVKNWFNHGLSTPGGMSNDIYHHLTVRNVTVKDVDAAGIWLRSWLERPSDGRKGLRGGHHLTLENNVVDGANAFGLSGFFAESTFTGNAFRNIALIANLNKAGMSCGTTSSQCTENGDGFRILSYEVIDSGFNNTLRYNTFEKIGYNAIDVFGPGTLIEKNFITQACYSKADCGGVRLFGDTGLAATPVYNVRLLNNILVDITGNVDGCEPTRVAFGMGLYVDNYSRDIETRGNTIISTTYTGLLYQHSTGVIADNTVYNASGSPNTEYSAHISLGGDDTRATLSGNKLFGLDPQAWTLYARSLSNYVSSDYNYLFHPYVSNHIAFGPAWTRYTFAGWKTYSGRETNSKTNWFTQAAGETPRARILYNATQSSKIFDLGLRQYLDLDQNTVLGSVTLAPFTSLILVDNGLAGLQLLSLTPALWGADAPADFTLTLLGSGFTADSEVRWNGSPRPTTLVNSYTLTAAIAAADVSALAEIPVTVSDPGGSPTETPPLTFRVVAHVQPIYLPIVRR